ncbi:MAG: hypothetical protein IJR85_11405 [Synergistaceae bacterium]|nr:hypothetical protein [Synergistaceae bacterium]
MTNSLFLELYRNLREKADTLTFLPPVSRTYNPLRYAWHGFSQYTAMCPDNPRVVFLGMNPGPWGMTQTGVPFGEVGAVRNFLGIHKISITPPENTHPAYPVKGLECSRSEVSGKRLWGLFRDRFGTAENFFREHIVLNYCPLLFLKKSPDGRAGNLTPDKLAKPDREKLFALCDECLRQVIAELKPEVVVGVGAFAEKRAQEALKGVKIVRILHPSPASPASNQDWAGKVTSQLIDSGVWQ